LHSASTSIDYRGAGRTVAVVICGYK